MQNGVKGWKNLHYLLFDQWELIAERNIEFKLKRGGQEIFYQLRCQNIQLIKWLENLLKDLKLSDWQSRTLGRKPQRHPEFLDKINYRTVFKRDVLSHTVIMPIVLQYSCSFLKLHWNLQPKFQIVRKT